METLICLGWPHVLHRSDSNSKNGRQSFHFPRLEISSQRKKFRFDIIHDVNLFPPPSGFDLCTKKKSFNNWTWRTPSRKRISNFLEKYNKNPHHRVERFSSSGMNATTLLWWASHRSLAIRHCERRRSVNRCVCDTWEIERRYWSKKTKKKKTFLKIFFWGGSIQGRHILKLRLQPFLSRF